MNVEEKMMIRLNNNPKIKLIKSPLQNVKEEELKLFLKDILEDEVDSKYYLTEKQVDKLLERTKVNINVKEKSIFDVYNKKVKTDGCCPTLTDPCHNNLRLLEPKIVQLNNPTHSNNRVYSPEGISPTLNTMQGGNRQPKIMTVNSKGERIKNIPSIGEAHRIYSGNGISPSVKESGIKVVTHSLYPRSGNPKKGGTGHLSKTDGTSYCLDTGNCQAIEKLNTIRKLTPLECFRLMGFLNDEIKLEGLSNTQKYKLAGNGWDINLVSKIFKQMFKGENKQW